MSLLPRNSRADYLVLLSTLVLFLSVFVGASLVQEQQEFRAHAQTANPNASADARKILKYLSCLPNRANNRVISGQYVSGPGSDGQLWPPNAYEDYVVRLYNETGKWVAMIGLDYSGVSLSDFSRADIQSVNQQLINYWNQGGLALLMATTPNPWGGKVRDNYDRVDLTELLTPGTTVNKIWMSMLDKVAKGLADLRDAGVVVLFRPFHEMNGGWFWWSFDKGGRVSPVQFTRLWRHIFDYFTYNKGLNNLIWAYGPDREHIPLASWQKPVLYYYPGDAYVDIVGLSVYSDKFDDWGGYSDLVALGKPFFFLEQGPRQQRCCGNWDTTIVTQSIKQRYPKITGFLFWSDWPGNIMSMVTNLNAAALMNDPWVITREELDWRTDSCASGGTPPPPTTATPTKVPTPTPSVPLSSSPTPPSSVTNLIRNPSFELGTQDWSFNTDGVGTFTVGSPAYEGISAAKVVITTPGTNVQLYQTGISLEPSTAYTLSFAARSNTGDDLSVVIHQHGSPYTNYGLNNFVVNLTSSWQTFSTTFTSTNSLPVSDARLRFWFAPYDATGDEYFIDAVSLSKITVNTLKGDIDGDNDVDIFDYNLLIENFGVTNCGNVADIDSDCDVDIFDYNILIENFGRTAPTDTIPQNAFRGQYFNNLDFTNLVHTRTDAVIDFDWGFGSPVPAVDPDTFSVRWEGNWDFAQASTYRFTAKTDDGMRVWVDGQLIIDAWKQQAATVYTADLNLAAGTHRIKVEYYEDPELAVAGLSWKLAVGSTPTPSLTGTPAPPPPPPPPGDIFSRKDLIYGTEIGTWSWGDAYDGHPLTSNQTCRQLARDAKISVVRWSPLEPFDDMGSVGGVSCSALQNGCLMPRVQFDNVVSGIVDIGALPLIKTAPGWRQCEADGFTTAAYAGWFKEIVKQAGSRVQLYELSNEANYYCGWSAEKYAQSWIQIIPQVKQYARSLGLEIYVGGSSWSNPNFNALKTFMETVKAEYDRTGNSDLIPSFISFHTYPAWSTLRFTQQDVLNEIPKYADFVRSIRSESQRIFGYELPVADTEYNYTADLGGGSRWDYDVSFMDKFTRGMLKMFRDSGAWMGIQFTFASGGGGGVIDMVEANCTPKPQYNTFKEVSISDPLR